MKDNGFWTRSRVTSGCTVLAYVIVALAFRGPETALRLLAACLVLLLFIWFPEYMGRYYRGIWIAFPRKITEPSPPFMIFILGWGLLLLLGATLLLLGLSS